MGKGSSTSNVHNGLTSHPAVGVGCVDHAVGINECG